MCPEGRQVFAEMSVLENLEMGAHTRKDGEQLSDIEQMLDLFPVLRQRAKQRAGTLSGGEQEMLAIARALMARPKLCIFDEPSLGLAPKIVEEVEQILVRIKAMGSTIVLVEQNAAMALRLADRAYVLGSGRGGIAWYWPGTQKRSASEQGLSWLLTLKQLPANELLHRRFFYKPETTNETEDTFDVGCTSLKRSLVTSRTCQ